MWECLHQNLFECRIFVFALSLFFFPVQSLFFSMFFCSSAVRLQTEWDGENEKYTPCPCLNSLCTFFCSFVDFSCCFFFSIYLQENLIFRFGFIPFFSIFSFCLYTVLTIFFFGYSWFGIGISDGGDGFAKRCLLSTLASYLHEMVLSSFYYYYYTICDAFAVRWPYPNENGSKRN